MGRTLALADETAATSVEQNYLFALRGHLALLERLESLGKQPVRAFLRHVSQTVPYFQATPRSSLKEYEVTTRAMMREDRQRFLSSVFLEDAERFIARTNGTLSPSLPVSFDHGAFYDFNYFSLYRLVDARPGLADSLVSGEVGVVLVSDDPDQLRYTVRMPLFDDCLMRRLPLGRSDEEDRSVVRYLREHRVSVLQGKPHTLRMLARLDRQIGGERLQPRAIICAGDRLYRSDRARLVAAFGVDPIDAYMSSEGGLMAIGCADGHGLHVVDDRVLLEVLDGDVIRPYGAGELLVTNLVNWAHAFIRYRQNDEVELRRSCACGHRGPTLVKLAGRDVAWFDVPAVGRVTSEQLESILDRPEVIQFEVRQQESGELAIQWIADDGVRASAVARELEHGLAALVGRSATLSQTERITVFGGKQRRFIPASRPISA